MFLSGKTVSHVDAPFLAAKSRALFVYFGRLAFTLRTLSLAACSLSIQALFLACFTLFSSGSMCDCDVIFSTRGAVAVIDDAKSNNNNIVIILTIILVIILAIIN